MTVMLRPARKSECAALSALCLRSKAHWGYDAAFLDQCREELTVTDRDIQNHLIVAETNGHLAGVAQVGPLDDDADLLLLFVDPPFMGQRVGRALFDWSVTEARQIGAQRLMIDADPGAEAFYLRMGARRIGEHASVSIPGRMLPLLEMPL